MSTHHHTNPSPGPSTSISFDPTDHPLGNLLKVATNTNLSVEARLLYVILVLMAWSKGRCWPSQAYQAQALGRSDRAVRNYQQELEKVGLMLIERTPGRVNHYHPAILTGTHSKTPEPDNRPTPETGCRITLKEELQNVKNVLPIDDLGSPSPSTPPDQENVNAIQTLPKSPSKPQRGSPPQTRKSFITPDQIFLVEEIERTTGDTWSRGHFFNLVRQVDEQTIWSALSVTREKISLESGVNAGAYFTSTLRGMAEIQSLGSHKSSSTSPVPETTDRSSSQICPVAEPPVLEEIDPSGLVKGWKIMYRPGDLSAVLSQVQRCLPGWDAQSTWKTLKFDRAGASEEEVLDEFLDLCALKVQFQSNSSRRETP